MATSLLTGIFGSKGAKKAAAQQTEYLNKALDQQNTQYQQARADFLPGLQFGQSAYKPLSDLLGFNGNDAQSVAYNDVESSPAYTSRFGSGLDALNQSLAASGGVRGGNGQLGRADFGQQLLAQVLGERESNLFNVANMGSGTVSKLGDLGQQNSNANTSILGNIGNAQASGTLGSTNSWINSINDFQKQLMQAFSGGGGF